MTVPDRVVEARGPETQDGTAIVLRGTTEVAVAYGADYGDASGVSAEAVWRSSPDNGATWVTPEVLPDDPWAYWQIPSILWRSTGRAYVLVQHAPPDGEQNVYLATRP